MILVLAILATLSIWMIASHLSQPEAKRIRVRTDERRRHDADRRL